MGVNSYFIFPKPGRRQSLAIELAHLPGCEVLLADNHDDLVVLITETKSGDEEAMLQEALKDVKSVQCMALTSNDVYS